MNSKIDSIIFDIDGTLWDMREEIADAWNYEVKRQGYPEYVFTVENMTPMYGIPVETVADIMMPELAPEIRYALINDFSIYQFEKIKKSRINRLYPKVKETIKELSKNYQLFIVSNCYDGYIEVFMDKSGTASFIKDFECSGKTGLPKSENIQMVIERNHLKSPIYVGDTQGDADAAKQAGIPFIFANYGFGNVSNPLYSIQNFSELLKILEK